MFKAFTQTWLCHVLPTKLGLLKQQQDVRQLVSSRITGITEQVTHGLKQICLFSLLSATLISRSGEKMSYQKELYLGLRLIVQVDLEGEINKATLAHLALEGSSLFVISIVDLEV